MKRIEKEHAIHVTADINLALYEHCHQALIVGFEAHWHPEYEMEYVYQGPVTFFMGGQNYTLHSNEILFIDKNAIHSCSDPTANDTHYVSIVFGEEFVFSSQTDALYRKYIYPLQREHKTFPPVITGATPGGMEILNAVRTFLDIYHQKNTAFEFGLRSTLLQVFQSALEHDIFVESRGNAVNSIIEQSLLAIRQNYMNPISIHELAASQHVTHNYFCRLFKSFVGKSPKAYLVDYRISIASSLLAQTDEPVSSIAYACGFDDINYFARCFKKRNGLSPSEYRRRSQVQVF